MDGSNYRTIYGLKGTTSMFIILQKAQNIERDPETKMPFSWQGTGENVKTFTNGDEYVAYVKQHAKELKDVVAFTGSASLLQQANFILVEELKKVGLVKWQS